MKTPLLAVAVLGAVFAGASGARAQQQWDGSSDQQNVLDLDVFGKTVKLKAVPQAPPPDAPPASADAAGNAKGVPEIVIAYDAPPAPTQLAETAGGAEDRLAQACAKYGDGYSLTGEPTPITRFDPEKRPSMQRFALASLCSPAVLPAGYDFKLLAGYDSFIFETAQDKQNAEGAAAKLCAAEAEKKGQVQASVVRSQTILEDQSYHAFVVCRIRKAAEKP